MTRNPSPNGTWSGALRNKCRHFETLRRTRSGDGTQKDAQLLDYDSQVTRHVYQVVLVEVAQPQCTLISRECRGQRDRQLARRQCCSAFLERASNCLLKSREIEGARLRKDDEIVEVFHARVQKTALDHGLELLRYHRLDWIHA